MVQHGGKDAEDGSEFRARVGALLSTSILLGDRLTATGCPVGEVPESIAAETDDPVDDLVVREGDGRRVLFQAKQTVTLRTAPNAPLAKALEQFARAGRERPSDLLVLVTSSLSRSLRKLDDHLAASGRAQPPSITPEARVALEKVRSALAAHGLDQDQVNDVLRRTRFWQVDPRNGAAYAVTASRMVQAGFVDGERAAETVTALVRTLARERAGEAADGIVVALRRKGLTVRPLPTVGAPVAESALLADYRDRLVTRGRTLEVLGVPRAVADLPLADADAEVRVTVPPSGDDESDERDRQRDVAVAVRRRGRAVLVGAGGAGKSTALRRLCSDWAEDPYGPLPVLVACTDLSDKLDDLSQGLSEVVARELVDDSQRAALARAIRRKLARGEVLIALDGLDEITRGREHFARKVSAWLDELPEECEVVLTARPTVGTSLDHFPWPRLHLLRPDRPEELGSAVIDAVASESNQRGARRRWLSERLRRDRALGETPLTVMLLAVLAARAKDLNALPTSRAEVLKRTLTDLIEHWEVGNRRRGNLVIGQLTAERAAIAVRLVLWRLASRALDRGLENPVLRDLSDVLGDALDLKPWEAEAAAEAAKAFWLETGLFAIDEAGAVVTAALRPIAEAASAWQMVETGEKPDFSASSDRKAPVTVISLAAGLDPGVLNQWVDWVTETGGADDFVDLVEAHHDGARLHERQVGQLVRGALHRWLEDSRDLERMFEACVRLPLTGEHRRIARGAMLAGNPVPDRQALFRSAVKLRWPETAAESWQAADEVFDMHEPPPLDEEPPAGVIWFPMRDQFYEAAVETAAIALVGRSRIDAEAVAERFEEQGSFGFRRKLHKGLLSAGHTDLAEAIANPKSLRHTVSLFKDIGDMEAAEQQLMSIMQGLAVPVGLTVPQRRRFDEIADFYKTVAGNYVWPNWVLKHPEACRLLYDIVADLGGFDRAVIAAQASALGRELEHNERMWFLLGDGSRRRPVDCWNRRRDPAGTVKELVVLWTRVPRVVLPVIRSALLSTPEQDLALHELKGLLPRLRKTQTDVAELCLVFAGTSWRSLADEWWSSPDPQVRQAIAWTAAHLWRSEERAARDIVQALVNDDDVHVRAEAIEALADAVQATDLHVEALLTRVLLDARDNPVGATECRNCLEIVPPNGRSCPSCSVVVPSPGPMIDELLGVAPQEARRRLRPLPRRRRVSSQARRFDEDE